MVEHKFQAWMEKTFGSWQSGQDFPPGWHISLLYFFYFFPQTHEISLKITKISSNEIVLFQVFFPPVSTTVMHEMDKMHQSSYMPAVRFFSSSSQQDLFQRSQSNCLLYMVGFKWCVHLHTLVECNIKLDKLF